MKRHKKTINSAESQTDDSVVLVVDDEEDSSKLITDWLSAEGIRCRSAASVGEAITILKRDKIALALLDWVLDRSGVEVLRFCRERNPLMPVIVLSGQPWDARTDALTRDADGFLNKLGLSSTLVVSHVTHWLGRVKETPKAFWPEKHEDILSLDQLRSFYFRHVVRLLEGNVSLAAEKLGIHRQTVSAALKDEASAN